MKVRSPEPSTAWCDERLRLPDEDLALAVLFTPNSQREPARALAAVYVELERIITGACDPNIARIKIAWWQEELSRLASGRAEHPATRLFAAHASTIPTGALADLLTGAELRLLAGPVNDLATATRDAERGGEPLGRLLAGLSGEDPAWSRPLGRAIGLARCLGNGLTPADREDIATRIRETLRKQVPPRHEPGFHPALRVLAALAWQRTKYDPGDDTRGAQAKHRRVFTAWRAARGHLPSAMSRA